MNWEILNIEPTSDKERIRQAYAKEVKRWHPEEHPNEFRMLRQAYREALRLAEQEDPRDAVFFIPWDVSQDEPSEQNSGQGKVGTYEYGQSERKQEPQLEETDFGPIPDWNVTGKPALRTEECLKYMKCTKDFLVHFLKFQENEIYASELGGFEYFLNKEQYQKLYSQPRFWYEFAVFWRKIKKTDSDHMDGAVRYYVWQFAESKVPKWYSMEFLLKILQLTEEDHACYEKAEADKERKETLYKLMEQADQEAHEIERQEKLLRNMGGKNGEAKRQPGYWWVFIVLGFFVFLWIISAYSKTKQEESQSVQPMLDFEQYEQYQQYNQQQQFQIDPEKIKEAQEAMQSLQVTEEETEK